VIVHKVVATAIKILHKVVSVSTEFFMHKVLQRLAVFSWQVLPTPFLLLSGFFSRPAGRPSLPTSVYWAGATKTSQSQYGLLRHDTASALISCSYPIGEQVD
jgi:hypothetical protein